MTDKKMTVESFMGKTQEPKAEQPDFVAQSGGSFIKTEQPMTSQALFGTDNFGDAILKAGGPQAFMDSLPKADDGHVLAPAGLIQEAAEKAALKLFMLQLQNPSLDTSEVIHHLELVADELEKTDPATVNVDALASNLTAGILKLQALEQSTLN